jgi:FkbM family methyltransferase
VTFVSYAQNFEDVMLWRALRDVGHGFYIDVGANDPTLYSVTKAFYLRGWRGINLEPTSSFFDRLAAERPEDTNLRLAAGAGPGRLTLYDVVDTGLSTTDAEVAERHRRAGFAVTTSEVEVRTLDDICAQFAPADIHFVKIDVEGTEKDVLAGLDLRRWRPWILVIEATVPGAQVENHDQWEDHVLGRGYRFAYADGLNRFYVAQERDALLPAFRYPPNVFDGFTLNANQESFLRAQEAEGRAAQSREALTRESARAEAALARAQALEAAAAEARARAEATQARLSEGEAQAEQTREAAARAAQQAAAAQARAEKERTRAALAEQRADESQRQVKLLVGEITAAGERARALQAEVQAASEARALFSERLARREELLDWVYASRSWRITRPLRALGEALRARRQPQEGSAATAAPVAWDEASLRPTIFVECTHTYHSDLNTGIQRVVRNVLRNAEAVAAAHGYRMAPVIVEDGRFVVAAADAVLRDKLRAGAPAPAPADPDVPAGEVPRGGEPGLSRRAWRAGLRATATLLPFAPVRRFLYAPPEQWGLARGLRALRRMFRRGAAAGTTNGPARKYLDQRPSCLGDILLLLDSSWTIPLWPAVRNFKSRGGRVVGVIFDLIPITHPHTSVPELCDAFRAWIDVHRRHADCFVGISGSVARQLADHLARTPASRPLKAAVPIRHFHLGSELDFVGHTDDVRAKVAEIFATHRHVFLMVGSIEPRKNHTFVLDAFDRFWRDGGEATLLFIGRSGWKTEEFIARVERHHGLGRQLHLLRDANDSELDYAYRNASALVIASEIEGFGLPVVEAFQRGLPVLCSDIPVFREIADGRATFFDLSDAARLTEVLRAFCASHDPAARAARAPQPWLTWRESTEQLFSAFLDALDARAARRTG